MNNSKILELKKPAEISALLNHPAISTLGNSVRNSGAIGNAGHGVALLPAMVIIKGKHVRRFPYFPDKYLSDHFERPSFL
ncbi:MAG: hypothetical protein BM485_13810 [Desulfobulbaceae bacterium DB1]|nr:MAG: hypothetical protein BM485_13810 [Desulfobulbaceae bacterium DB1]